MRRFMRLGAILYRAWIVILTCVCIAVWSFVLTVIVADLSGHRAFATYLLELVGIRIIWRHDN